jgi:hypothetical protein
MQYDRSAAAVTGVRTQPERPRLLDEVRRRLRMKHYSLRTEQAYLYWIRRYIQANGRRHPREMGGAEVERFLSDLARKGRVAPSTQNQALSALPFLYREALELKLPWMDEVVRGKRPQRLPTLLSQAEVRAAKALFRPPAAAYRIEDGGLRRRRARARRWRAAQTSASTAEKIVVAVTASHTEPVPPLKLSARSPARRTEAGSQASERIMASPARNRAMVPACERANAAPAMAISPSAASRLPSGKPPGRRSCR